MRRHDVHERARAAISSRFYKFEKETITNFIRKGVDMVFSPVRSRSDWRFCVTLYRRNLLPAGFVRQYSLFLVNAAART